MAITFRNPFNICLSRSYIYLGSDKFPLEDKIWLIVLCSYFFMFSTLQSGVFYQLFTYYLFVEAQWLSGRMPDSRSRERRHESPTHWRRWWRLVVALLRHDKTKPLYLYFAINRDLFIYLCTGFLFLMILCQAFCLWCDHLFIIAILFI